VVHPAGCWQSCPYLSGVGCGYAPSLARYVY
jgi:hypothetical protein